MIRKPRRAAEHANQSSARAATATRSFGCTLLEDHTVREEARTVPWGGRRTVMYLIGRGVVHPTGRSPDEYLDSTLVVPYE